jgi:hypothetical protein
MLINSFFHLNSRNAIHVKLLSPVTEESSITQETSNSLPYPTPWNSKIHFLMSLSWKNLPNYQVR